MSSRKAFLGRGWRFPVGVDSRGSIAMSEFEDNIRECIQMIISTPIGTRMMRPDFGCKIHDFVFYPNNANTAAICSYYVRDALMKWEPRIDDVVVAASPDPKQTNVLKIDIRYKVPQDNNIRNMVYPFYLRREQDL